MRNTAVVSLALMLLVFCSGNEDNPGHQTIELSTLKPAHPFKGKILFQSDMDGDREIYLLTSQGIKPLTNNDWDDEYPKWSPDRKKIAYSANPRGNYDIFVMDADGSNITPVAMSDKNEIEHAWFPDGKNIAFTIGEKKGLRRKFSLWMVNLTSKRISRILPEFQGSSALPDFSPTSSLVGFTGKRAIGWDVFTYDRKSKELTALTEGGKACRPHFSRDGQKIAYVSGKADGNGDIWLMNPDGTEKVRLTERDETADYFPSWSEDQEYIVFSSSLEHRIDKGNWSLFLVNVKTKEIAPLFDSPGRDVFPDWE